MSSSLTHHTADGDRWDLLAWTYYGDATLLIGLLRANPLHAALSVLPGGLTLRIPVLEEAATASGADDYSPWSVL